MKITHVKPMCHATFSCDDKRLIWIRVNDGAKNTKHLQGFCMFQGTCNQQHNNLSLEADLVRHQPELFKVETYP